MTLRSLVARCIPSGGQGFNVVQFVKFRLCKKVPKTQGIINWITVCVWQKFDSRRNSSNCKMEDEYESLPETSTVSTHMLAGAAAGIMEHCVMYPLDCVKVRCHAFQFRYKTQVVLRKRSLLVTLLVNNMAKQTAREIRALQGTGKCLVLLYVANQSLSYRTT